MSHLPRGVALLAAPFLACVVLGPASARTPAKYGGTLVVGLSSGDPDTLDPTVSLSSPGLAYWPAICQQLFSRDAKQQLVPVLAAALPVLSKDKLSYTVQLRQGILFNDGTPFNAQAVVTTVERFMTYPGSVRTGSLAGVESVSTSGQYTVVYHLKQRDSTFVGGDSFVLSPTQLAKPGANFASNPVCVGPFMFDHRVAGDNITVVKSPYYYDQAHVYLDKIVFKPMSETAAATAALKAGDIQALDHVSTTELDGIRQTSSLRVIQGYQLGWEGLIINIGNKNGILNLPYANVGTPLASNPKLRQAFEEAIDRNAMNKVVYGGAVQVTCTPIPPANTAWFDGTKVPCTPYDPKDAKRLLAAAGFPNLTVRLLVKNRPDEVRLAQFIQAQEAAVGINVVLDVFESTTALARGVAGNFDTFLASSLPGGPDPSTSMTSLATSGARNRGGYSNLRLDLILSNGLKATSVKARSTLYHVAQQILANDRPVVFLFNPMTFSAFSTNLTGVQMTSNGEMTVANARYK